MLTLHGLPSCDSCRKARAWLDRHDVACRFHDVRADGLDRASLQRWSAELGWEALVNRRSTTWRKLPAHIRDNLDESSAIATLVEHPTLLKRPVLAGNGILEVGFDPERYTALI